MSAFLSEILAFPTVVYTILLGVSLTYWGVSMLGVVDLDGLDGLDSADGAAEALDGALDGAADSLDGAGESLDSGAGTSRATALDGATAGADAQLEKRESKGRVPATISFSLFSLFAWSTSFLVVHNLAANPADPSVAMILGAGAGAAAAGYGLSKLVGAPLARVLAEKPAVTSREMIGLECEVTTGKVTTDFGQATIADGGAGMTVNVRCEPGRLARGSKAIVIDYDPKDGVYTVEPMEELELLIEQSHAEGS